MVYLGQFLKDIPIFRQTVILAQRFGQQLLVCFLTKEMSPDYGHQNNESSFEDVSLLKKRNFIVDEIDNGHRCWILMYVILISQKSNSQSQQYFPCISRLLLKRKRQYIEKSNEIEHTQFHIKSNALDLDHVLDLEMGVRTEVDLCHIVKIVIINGLLHDFF